jgi:hypothetical protein
MSLIACPECRKKISDTTDSCPNCGYKLTPAKVAEIKKKKQQVQKGYGIGCLSVIVIFVILYLIGSFSSDENDTPIVQLPLKVGMIKVGMTWDECVPMLRGEKRVTLARQGPDRFTDTYKIGDAGYSLTFERPASPEFGPYRLVRIEPAKIAAEAEKIEPTRELKPGMPLNEALPIMRRAGGYFLLETRDRIAAVLQSDSGIYRVTFERPKGVSHPGVIADATPELLRMSGRIPLDALPEFGEYRITAVKKTD